MKRPFYKMKRFIIPAALLLVIGGGTGLAKRAGAKKEAKRIAELSPARPLRGVLVTKTQATGNVEPENRVLVTPSVSGRAEQVLFKEGQMVAKGQVLAWVSSSERTGRPAGRFLPGRFPEGQTRGQSAGHLARIHP
ncbi:MAG: efflux RND transporter periplasmic adaptor subunit [Elusimicrobia bacterium]|nr:efflux RND transporter periplasmic adaptor subunit [Elusimicrobiota bacterium]